MSESQCENLATFRRFWPGSEPDFVCADHAMDSKRIGFALGFVVPVEPIGYLGRPGSLPAEFPTCCCSAGFYQTKTQEREVQE